MINFRTAGCALFLGLTLGLAIMVGRAWLRPFASLDRRHGVFELPQLALTPTRMDDQQEIRWVFEIKDSVAIERLAVRLEGRELVVGPRAFVGEYDNDLPAMSAERERLVRRFQIPSDAAPRISRVVRQDERLIVGFDRQSR